MNALRPSLLALSVAAVLSPVAQAESNTDPAFAGIERIQVTSSRRLTEVDQLPYNISVMDGEQLKSAGVGNVAELGLTVPGLTVVDTGARNDSPMTMRGLTVDELSANDGGGNGGTVSVYVDDTPLLVDLKLHDVARVEVLRGPQGTLYGAGSLGGTLRYMLNKPELGETSGQLGAKSYQVAESDSLSHEVYGVLNLPLVDDSLALRVAVDRVDEAGFVDYSEVLAGPVEDATGEETTNGRVALRYAPTADLDMTLTHLVQDQWVGGRQAVNPAYTGDKYSSSLRYEEPLDRKVSLSSLELSWSTEFATLVSSTSYTRLEELGQRDQTDLLITAIWPGYADYNDFSAYTREDIDNTTFTQELRLVSNDDGDISWIAGIYYSNEDNWERSIEFTPGYPEYLGLHRPDNIEYFELTEEDVTEKAIFGELTWQLTDNWSITGGVRAFDLEQSSGQCLDFPIDEGVAGNVMTPECSQGKGDNSDTIFKFSSFFEVNSDLNFYLSVAEGFRRGGSNGVPEGGQVSFTEDEKQYNPDTVTNYELGWHATLADNTLAFNGGIYYIDWQDLQLSGKTEEGAIPITINGGSARSRGVEVETVWAPIAGLNMTLAYAFTDAQLTEDAPSLDGFDGDKVPGVPRHEGAITASYSWALNNGWENNAFVGVFMKSAVNTRVNALPGTANEDNQKLAGFATVNASYSLSLEDWQLKLYANNLLNKYAIVGARGARDYGDQGQFQFINKPRTLGVEVSYQF